MVTGYTATEYGDFIIASLNDPYLNTVKVLDWEIVVGLQNNKTVGTINTTQGSTTILGNVTNFSQFSEGDIILIGNVQYEVANVITPIEMELTQPVPFSTTDLDFYVLPDNRNYFEYQYRWSSNNDQFSELRPLTNNISFTDLKGLTFDSNKPLWLDVRAEVASIQIASSLSILSITYTLETVDGQIESCPQFCVECTDPFAYEGCANIEVSCDANIFQPYNLGKSNSIYKQLVGMTNDIFGHTVQYFRTESDKRTEDVILMEYSLHNVVDKKDIKILVPDNEFPEEAATYDIFGMEFAEFEVHIVAEEFENIFGKGKIPRSKDYMYIPLINRMYEISSLSIADEFNHTSSYWRVKLVKYQDRSSVIKNEFEVATDTLVTGVEEIFGEEQKEEMEKVTNPQQFKTVTTSYRDGIRGFMDKGLKIIDYDLKNRWTVVSKNYYDLTDVGHNEAALEYLSESKLLEGKNMAVSLWFNPQFDSTSTEEYVLFGDLAALSGFKIFLSNQHLRIYVNGTDYIFDHQISLQKGEWYGMILNLNNMFLQLSASIYRLKSGINTGTSYPNRPQDGTNDLVEEYTHTLEAGQPMVWDVNSKYHLRGNSMYLTNLRVFNKVVEYEQHHNVLNQYVVRDNQLSIIIDNAIPSLGFQKFVNSK